MLGSDLGKNWRSSFYRAESSGAERCGRSGKIEDRLWNVWLEKRDVRLTIEEINDAIAEAGAEAGMAGLER
jgi:hypothetical protein